ncbi:MAG: hypothetical protein U1E98_02445 [Moraxella osloensis]
MIAGNLEQRRQAAVEAELLVSRAVVAIERKYLVRQVGQDIQQYREQAKHHADMIKPILTAACRWSWCRSRVDRTDRKLTQTLTLPHL